MKTYVYARVCVCINIYKHLQLCDQIVYIFWEIQWDVLNYKNSTTQTLKNRRVDRLNFLLYNVCSQPALHDRRNKVSGGHRGLPVNPPIPIIGWEWWGSWNHYQQTLGKPFGTPYCRANLRHKQPFTLGFTPIGNLEWPSAVEGNPCKYSCRTCKLHLEKPQSTGRF